MIIITLNSKILNMRDKLLFSVTLLFMLLLVAFLNGSISLSSGVLPPFGAFLNPFQGVWANGAQGEELDMELNLPGLTDKVEIIYDDRRVPHIFAQNMGDALYAQGFVEAQNRLFQMEFLAMAASGSLSSVMGEATLAMDLDKRRRGMTHAAENSLAGWEKHDDYNQAYRYVDGVNAYINSLSPEDYPLEFKLLNMKPSEWTPLKTAYIFKQMSQTLAGYNDDIEYTNLLFHLGMEDFSFLYPERETDENPVIPAERSYVSDSLVSFGMQQQAVYSGDIRHAYMESRNKNAGSNSWGLAGSRTSTGKPVFCNDPHLSLGLPSIWFEVHIHTPECNAYGVSFPGFPGIMIGFNENIAWGETNVGQDVEDLFLIQWTDETRTHYWLDSQKVAATYRLEHIDVKGGKTVVDTVWYTHWGPVYFRSSDGKHDLALRWLCHDEPDTDEFNTFIDAMKCRNYDDYLAATERYIAPAQNFGFASRDGDIALRVNGRLPAKGNQDGRFVELGNTSANNWQAWIPKKQVPQILNPERGFISSANQVSADKTYPYYFNGEFERYRNRTINDKLSSTQQVTPEEMKAMQQDAHSQKAADYVPLVLSMISKNELPEQQAVWYDTLAAWNYQYRAHLSAPSFFEVFYRKMVDNTWDELAPLKEKMDIKMPDSWRLFELLKAIPDYKYFDIQKTPEKEQAADIVKKSWTDATAELEDVRKEGKGLAWGARKPLNIHHLARIPAFSRLNMAVDGCPDAINATGSTFGPSWRMVVSLEEKVKAWVVYPGGQSGNPVSKYYSNMVDAWAAGEYYTPHFIDNTEELKRVKTQFIVLNPKS